MADKLATYRKMRNFRKTEEPRGKRPAKRAAKPIFVVQKHDATALHYDFRLEIEGTLKSWAVPKGPSTDPEVKRLAMEVEDHPKEYATFEGIIPQGEYGGGTVMVWDRGTFEYLGEKNALASWTKGHIKFRLMGEKLKGAWALTRIGDKRQWLLVKIRDEAANPRDITVTKPKSVKTGRTLKQIEKAGGPTWHSKPRARAKANHA